MKTIEQKPNTPSWKRRIGLVLIFTLLFSVCMHEGWRSPNEAQAASLASCSDCHDYPPVDGTARNTPAGAVVGSHSEHIQTEKPAYTCSLCHVAPATTTSADFKHRTGKIAMKPGATGIFGGFYDKLKNSVYSAGEESFVQTNNPVLSTCINVCHGGGLSTGLSSTTTPTWGWTTGTAKCTGCHNNLVSALSASALSGGTTTNRRAITPEFGSDWGHRNKQRAAVQDGDCIVCHLEGQWQNGVVGSTVIRNKFHGDGRIDLRDPDGSGEAGIKNIAGTMTYSFVRFQTSYSAGSRSSVVVDNQTDNVLTRKFCLGCHDKDGATNTLARSNNGGTGTQYMPFGGINMNTAASYSYNLLNGASTTGGLVDVRSQLLTTNASYHPVLGPLNRDFPAPSRLQAPYNSNGGRAGTSGSKTLSVVMNCFDCHVAPTSPTTTMTFVSHGSTTANHLRGNIYVSTAPNLCTTACHRSDYVTNGGKAMHGPGSAFASVDYSHGATTFATCNNCHLSTTATAGPVRPVRGQDIHGFNRLNTGVATDALWPTGATESWRPYGFLRNTKQYTGTGSAWRPFRGTEAALTSGTANCGTGPIAACDTGSTMSNYAPGGSY